MRLTSQRAYAYYVFDKYYFTQGSYEDLYADFDITWNRRVLSEVDSEDNEYFRFL